MILLVKKDNAFFDATIEYVVVSIFSENCLSLGHGLSITRPVLVVKACWMIDGGVR